MAYTTYEGVKRRLGGGPKFDQTTALTKSDIIELIEDADRIIDNLDISADLSALDKELLSSLLVCDMVVNSAAMSSMKMDKKQYLNRYEMFLVNMKGSRESGKVYVKVNAMDSGVD